MVLDISLKRGNYCRGEGGAIAMMGTPATPPGNFRIWAGVLILPIPQKISGGILGDHHCIYWKGGIGLCFLGVGAIEGMREKR